MFQGLLALNNLRSKLFWLREHFAKQIVPRRRKDRKRKEEERMKNFINYLKNEDGISTVEVLVIIAVLVAAALLFKDRLISFVNTYFDKLNTKTGGLF